MNNILNHFDRVRQKKSNKGLSEYDATCPSCAKQGKLCITEKPEKWLIFCRALCHFDEIIGAAGLQKGDVYKEGAERKPKPQFDTYHQALILIAESDMAKGKRLNSKDRALYRDAIRRRSGVAA